MTKNVEILNANAQRFYGCDHATALAINDGLPLRQDGTTVSRYLYQRQAAKDRGIAWEITLIEWCRVWQESGKWALRGIGRGSYCMSRYGDDGPYAVGNVEIKPTEENSREGIERARPAMRLNNNRGGSGGAARNTTGRGRGWTLVRSRRNPYQVMAGSRYVGLFATEEEARAAYLAAVALVHESLSVR